MNSNHRILIGTLAIVLFFTLPGSAQETGHGEHAQAPEAETVQEHSSSAEHDEHAEFKNELVLFLGATDESGHPSEFTWGLEYIYEISHRWGIGAFVDYAGGSLRNAAIGVPFVYNPGGQWFLMAAPGIEYHNGRGDSVEGHKAEAHGETDENEKYFLFRLGVSYSVPIGEHYSVLPAVYLDLVKGEEVWVYGLNFAYKF